MPGSIKLHEDLDGAFELVFVESQGASAEQAELFVYERGWMASGALWTTERPTSSGLGSLPSFVLLDGEGKVLMKGNTASMKSKIEKAIEGWLDDRRDLPERFPKSFRKAWQAFVDGDWAKALDTLDKLEAKGKDDAASVPELRDEIEAAVDAELARLDLLVERSLFVEAERAGERLAEKVEGRTAIEERIADALAPLGDEANAAEVEAARDLADLMDRVREDGVEDHAKKLAKFAKRYAGTKAAERAERLATLAG